MPEFKCDSPTCNSKLSAGTRDQLMAQVAEHVRTVHNIPVPTQSILSYLEKTSVTGGSSSEG
jgi:predicted small metal-binding protein